LIFNIDKYFIEHTLSSQRYVVCFCDISQIQFRIAVLKLQRSALIGEIAMSQNQPTISALRKAVESRDAMSLKALYAANAQITVIDTVNPPSKPRIIKGAADIGAYLEDVYSRDMTHTLDSGVVDGTHLAFTEGCRYADGTRVIASVMAELGPDGIVKQTIVQAWDS
jgi:hypothetical protein